MPLSFVSAQVRLAALLAAGFAVSGATALNVQAQEQEQVAEKAPLSATAQKRFAAQVRVLSDARAALPTSRRKLDSSLWVPLSSSTLRSKLPSLRVLQSSSALGARNLTIMGKVTTRLVSQVVRLGGTVLSSYPESDELNVSMTAAAADKIASYPEVKHIIPTLGAAAKRNLANAKRATAAGPTSSEGDTVHQAETARSQFGVTGKGIKVGVISDSADFLAASRKSGELGSVNVLANKAGTGKGTAMLEIIHDLAPEASLYFATAGDTAGSMARAITQLANAGCKIIVMDDKGFFNEPVYQEGVISKSITAATQKGVLCFSAAGNNGRRSFGISQTWEGTFVDGDTPVRYNLPFDSTYRINSWTGRSGASGLNTLERIGTNDINDLTLWWAEPLGQAENDYDLYTLDGQGNILASSTNVQDGDGLPFESIYDGSGELLNDGDYVVVTRHLTSYGSNQRLPLRLFSNTARFRFSTRGAVYGYAAAADVVSIAAAPAADAYPEEPKAQPGPFPSFFTARSPIEPFSSDGPRALYFAPDGSPKSASLQKPDLTAADGVTTSVPGFETFYGTAAAASHAAAIAALVWSRDLTQTNVQVRTKLTDTALRTVKWSPDAGFGIVMAPRAVDAAGVTLSVDSVSIKETRSAFNTTATIRLSKSLPYAVTVTYTTEDGTATAGSDYVAKSGTAVIAPNSTFVRVPIRILGDTTPESDETFTLTASSPSVSSVPAEGTISLLNDDASVNSSKKGISSGDS